MTTGTTLRLSVILVIVALGFAPAGAGDSALPIRIGATVSLSGPYSEPSAMVRDGYRLWEKQVNRHGGLLGRPVELILYDDHSDPETAYKLYRKLVHEDRVDLVFSPYGTPLTLQASQVTESRQMVMLACAAAGKVIWNRGYRFVFGIYALADRNFIGMLDLMARQGLTTVSILYEDSHYHIDVADGVERWANRFGVSVVMRQPFSPGRKLLSPLFRAVRDKNAHGLIISAYPPDGYRFLELMQQSAWRPKALGITISPTHPDFYRKAGPIAEGVFGSSQWEPDERIPFPGTAQFIQDFQDSYRKQPSYHAGSAYASCEILERAITEVGDIDHQRIRDYIGALDTVTVIGRFKVDQLGRQVGHNPILIQWQKGRKEIVYPTKMQTAKARF